MRIRRKATILTLVGVLSLIVAAQPVSACKYGCTPGFWKQPQHFGYWTAPYVPDGDAPTLVGQVFEGIGGYFPELADDTLLEALSYKGGRDLEGAARIYLRAAVATLLSSAYNLDQGGDPWQYAEWTPDAIANRVVQVLSWGSRKAIISNAEVFDGYNNTELGCPLEGQYW
jgi:hypothetical protein